MTGSSLEAETKDQQQLEEDGEELGLCVFFGDRTTAALCPDDSATDALLAVFCSRPRHGLLVCCLESFNGVCCRSSETEVT